MPSPYTPTKFSTHQTLVANAIDTVTFATDYQFVEVLNRDATNLIYFTADGSAPAIAADGTDVVSPGDSLKVPASVDTNTPNSTVVKLISAGAAAYSIRCS